MSEDFLGDRGKALADEFFHRKDQQRIDALRSELQRKSDLEALRDAACIGDEVALEGLFDQGLTAETVTAIALVPLVHVAWADGKIQGSERKAILQAAEKKGIQPGTGAAELLEGWLSEGEPEHLFDAWNRYIQALSSKLEPKARIALQGQIVAFAQQTAEAAGGILGIGSVSQAELDAIEQVRKAFNV